MLDVVGLPGGAVACSEIRCVAYGVNMLHAAATYNAEKSALCVCGHALHGHEISWELELI